VKTDGIGAGVNMLKLPFAKCNGDLIHVSEVASGRQPDCLCPECGQSLIAKKGNIRTPHFAHDKGAICNLESALHKIAKELIFLGVRKALGVGTSIRIHRHCEICGDEHEGDLLKKVRDVKLEYVIGIARPDVLLLSDNNQPIAAIEIIVTHPPEQRVREFYQANNIVLVEIKIVSEAQLLSLRDLHELHADFVSSCPTPKCPRCKAPLNKRLLHVVSGDCYRCKHAMQISFLEIENECYPPSCFSRQEQMLVRSQGCFLAMRYSHTARERYLANCCRNCQGFVGDFFLHDFWELANEQTIIQTELFCANCDKVEN
jgi:ssDNA-binding Zn-finger/Zn-ribbon topoisomerase 1